MKEGGGWEKHKTDADLFLIYYRTAGAPGGTKSPGNTSTSGLSGSAGVSMPAEAKTPPTAQNKQLQKGEHPSVSVRKILIFFFRLFI